MTRKLLACLLTAAVITGCGTEPEAPADPSKLDQWATWACDDFAAGYSSALTTHARVELADKIAETAPRSKTNRIADMAVVLANASDGSSGAWKIAADAFAQACLDAGYKP